MTARRKKVTKSNKTVNLILETDNISMKSCLFKAKSCETKLSYINWFVPWTFLRLSLVELCVLTLMRSFDRSLLIGIYKRLDNELLRLKWTFCGGTRLNDNLFTVFWRTTISKKCKYECCAFLWIITLLNLQCFLATGLIQYESTINCKYFEFELTK